MSSSHSECLRNLRKSSTTTISIAKRLLLITNKHVPHMLVTVMAAVFYYKYRVNKRDYMSLSIGRVTLTDSGLLAKLN